MPGETRVRLRKGQVRRLRRFHRAAVYNLVFTMASSNRSSGQQVVAIMSKPSKSELGRILPELVQWFRAHDYQIVIDRETSPYITGLEIVTRAEIAARPLSLAVVLGGDGTLLSAARAVAKAQVPVLGVNLGSLGFLTEIPLPELYSALEAVAAGSTSIEPRCMIDCKLMRDGKLAAQHEAINDVVASRSAISRLNNFELFVDEMFVTSYKADGLIVSTPTGSTAYSLAAGGPILTPSVSAFVITPVSPHSLTHRSLVVSDSSQIEIVVKTGSEKAYLSVDGQVGMPILDGDRIVCRKSEHIVRLLRIKKTFYEVLRTKLKWGER
jgi:NAD+ kinase